MVCLKYIRDKTDIHILEVVDAYKENSSFHVQTARVEHEDRLKVLPEIQRHIADTNTSFEQDRGSFRYSLYIRYTVELN